MYDFDRHIWALILVKAHSKTTNPTQGERRKWRQLPKSQLAHLMDRWHLSNADRTPIIHEGKLSDNENK